MLYEVITTAYNKRHLLKYGGEGEMFSKGEERVIVEYMGWRILLLVCYDLRFPVWSRNNDDYDFAVYVANWPSSRRNIHDILVKARAIENLSYVIACNRVGEDGKGLFVITSYSIHYTKLYEMRIAGAVTNNGVWRTVIGGNSTVEYNGGDQTVIIPNTSTNRYYNLILSGTGVKTLPATAMNIAGNFSVTDA